MKEINMIIDTIPMRNINLTEKFGRIFKINSRRVMHRMSTPFRFFGKEIYNKRG